MEFDWTKLTTNIGNILGASADAYSTVKTADALKHQQLNGDGGAYTNGAFQTTQQSGETTNTVLLIGAAVLLVMFLKD